MSKNYRITWCIIVLMLITALLNYGKKQDPKLKRRSMLHFSSELIRLDTERAENARIGKLIDVLEIKPGMVILDIGTGTGQHAYKFIEKMNDKIKVFATDIYSDLIDYVKDEKKRRGFNNLFPVLVSADGVDEFYFKQKYDLIYLSYSYNFIGDRINYFRKLKHQLSSNGYLVVVSYKIRVARHFILDDFANFDGLINELAHEPEDSPFYSLLRKSTLVLLNEKNFESLELLRSAVLNDLNIMLDYPYLAKRVNNKDLWDSKAEPALTFEENNRIEYNKLSLEETKSYSKKVKDLTKKELIKIRKINSFIIIQRFRDYIHESGLLLLQENNNLQLNEFKNRAISELENAGYAFKTEYDFIPHSSILVFTK